MSTVHLIDHPLVQHKLTLMRQKDLSTNGFRRLLKELAMLMAYEVTRDMPTQPIEIETPLETTTGQVIDGKKLVFVAILRAGIGILDGMLDVVPGARVGHVGLYRDPRTLTAVEYYFKLPADMGERDVIVVDPMLATGNSAIAAVERVKEVSPRSIKFVCLLACPEGIAALQGAHPDALLTDRFRDSCAVSLEAGRDRAGRGQRSLAQFVVELRAVMPALVIGSALAGAVQVLVPRDALLAIGSNPALSIIAMIALAMIVSICSNVDAFFALSFASTFTPGSIVAFLLVGPLVDVKMLALLRTTFRTRVLAGLVVIVVLFAIAVGSVVNLFA